MGDEEARSKRAFVLFGLFGLGFAVAVSSAACYPNPNDLRAGSGSAGMPGTGGRAAGTGGVTGGGGRAGTGGAPAGTGGAPTGTGGYVGAGTALIPNADGWIDGRTNAFGIQGAWYAFSDGRGPDGTGTTSPCIMAGHPASACATITSPPPGVFPNTGGKMCFVGSVARVSNIPGTATPDYDNIWGATMAVDVNHDETRNPPQGVINFPAKGLKGISFDIDAIPPYGLRIGFSTPATRDIGPAYWGGNPNYDPSPVRVGNNVVPLTMVSDPMGSAFDATMIEAIHFNVPTSVDAGAPFNFCVSNVNLLTQ